MARGARRLLIVGGAGRMGRLFSPFFRRRGYDVVVADPAGVPPGTRRAEPHDAREADVVVVSVPLPVMGAVLAEVLDLEPRGLVVELSSVKRGVRPLLSRARRSGVALASVHPMFGPSTRGIRGRDLILCDTGDARALAGARALFRGAGLKIATMPIAAHDPWIARTMGLAHLTGLVAAAALAGGGVPLDPPDGRSSTSFRRLAALAAPLLADDPDLLFEVQRAAPPGHEPHAALERALGRFRRALAAGPGAFARELHRVRGRSLTKP